ncbi:MAG: restriction endonuclease [candidate division WOR-3 bacterium]
MLNDPKLLSLFELLINQKIATITPVFAPDQDQGARYPVVESHLGAEANYVNQLLNDLYRLGYIERQFHERVFFCPGCNSPDLKYTIFCPKCNSPHLIRIRLLKHKPCNWSGPAEDFYHKDRRICPKCQGELYLLGGDYEDLGNRYRCEECGEITKLPVERWHCRSCNYLYDKEGVKEVVLYNYTLNPKQVTKFQEEKIPRARVCELLKKEGYEVAESVHLTGRSGAEHYLDILATKQTGNSEYRVVVGFLSGEQAVDSEEVIKLYAKAYDIQADETILVASPRLSEEAERFAQQYQMKVYTPETLSKLLVNSGKEG